jgi:hypothetical protein
MESSMLDRMDKLVDAIEQDDIFTVSYILEEDIISLNRIPLKYLAAALVIAAEKNSIHSFNAIIEYNSSLKNSIPSRYIRAAYSMFNSHKTYLPILENSTIH